MSKEVKNFKEAVSELTPEQKAKLILRMLNRLSTKRSINGIPIPEPKKKP